MAVNFRVEWVRLRSKDSNGQQNMYDVGDRAAVVKTLTGTALTAAGRVTAPASVNGFTAFHARIVATVECTVSIAPAGDAGTSYDVTQTLAGAIQVVANTPIYIPVKPGQLLSAATGIMFI